MELKIQADLNIAHQCACSRIFLKVGFNRIISIDYVIISAGFFAFFEALKAYAILDA